MGPIPRHPDKDLRAILLSAAGQGWRVEKRPRGYFKIYCPCPEKHLKTVHLTPGRNYLQNLRSWLNRETCWKEEA